MTVAGAAGHYGPDFSMGVFAAAAALCIGVATAAPHGQIAPQTWDAQCHWREALGRWRTRCAREEAGVSFPVKSQSAVLAAAVRDRRGLRRRHT